ncbi:hypothetical protein PM10SUCC1_04930 [Propionigenium maris DSM 9537]|uniref:HTH marR-type domain-containing protein n=1 Tax=Propionigenium maris DSM 9537 TaxID=1123000 RepID=A0A9W6LM20_9FUSO|nr:MarR family transcriptional regulator [Propionigenium maris]GLI54978.1 hypothetical protein PM10SUCC1_04930 [Propionigenium maris DSM 9537]
MNLLIELERDIFIPLKREANLTKTDMLILFLLLESSNITMYDIRKRDIIDPGLISRRIKFLEENGFIRRFQNGRAKEIALEERGKFYIEKVISFQKKYVKKFMNCILD